MKYTYLGRTGLKVSRLCLGTMNFGNYNDEKESFRIMDAALDAGINFFDTADNYGKATHNEGITETIIGKWFAQAEAEENVSFWPQKFMRRCGIKTTDRILQADYLYTKSGVIWILP